jgi:effector-binding domain-containing protein
MTMMTQNDEFQVIERPDRPYVAVTGRVTMQTIPEIADRYGEVFGWLTEQGLQPAGPPFFRYLVIDMDRGLVMQAGVPVRSPVQGSGEVEASVLPGGRYATTTYTGHPAELVEVTRRMLEWAEDQGLQWDVKPSVEGEVWGCRLEHHETDPAEEPDLNRWRTRLEFRLADA